MKRDRLPYILIPLVAFFAIHPLIVHGCSCGHDFDFHLLNWFEAARQFSHGTLYPQWAFTPAWGAGEPRFVFYPPLSWMLGALLGLVLPWTWTPIVYTWLALTAAGLALHTVVRRSVPPAAALLAAVVYLANPYTLFTAYERTAYGELLAAAILPFALDSVLRPRVSVLRVAIPIALLWLTNAPAAVMGCYAVALVGIVRLALTWRRRHNLRDCARFAASAVAGALLGLGSAAFYIVPAAYERRWVQAAMATIAGMSFRDNFLFGHTSDPDHDLVLHTASVVAVIVIGLSAAALLLAARSRRQPEPALNPEAQPLLPLAVLALVVVVLLTPVSAPLWSYTPELAFLQFPWRFLAVLAAVFGIALAAALSRIRLTPAMATMVALLAAVALALPSYRAFRQPCDSEDTVAARLALFRSANPGTDPTDEYTPTTADNDSLAHTDPSWWLSPDPSAPAPDVAATQAASPAPLALDLNLTSPETLILDLRRYPAWSVKVNGEVREEVSRDDGLIAIPLPAGPAHVRVTWSNGPDHTLGDSISVLSLGVIILIWLNGLRLRRTSPAF
ncbi:6-pyruvoyl-tetrahydropterin synthase-related protein [Edaphobacter bradus]|uniref:6-pyruvoyl-tetrahydropterin synthase-related protein n=1 Tax=Edaphobacter bradus TaxID=2259016 RepID=UPI0021DFE0C5|nr:6-pyruvoyl-tetrahydropterin synthase-related protein [Edaphobacter bradus]